jgi:hypothetical protein
VDDIGEWQRMNETEQALLQSLTELDAAVKSMPTANPKPNLLSIFARLDALAAQLPADSHPELQHYLRKKSYEKARLWLEGRKSEISRGGCQGD